MNTGPESGRRLGEAVQRRRLLVFPRGMEEFAEQVGVHKRTIQAIEYAERKINKSTKYRLESALHWAPGSVDRILAGGDPEELPLPTPQESPLKRKGSAQLVAEITERLTELASRIPPDKQNARPGDDGPLPWLDDDTEYNPDKPGMLHARWDASAQGPTAPGTKRRADNAG